MADIGYVMERRAKLLADAIRHRAERLARILKEPGKRTVFTTRLPEREALEWWRAHRNDEAGNRLMAGMKPERILELDRALARLVEEESMMPGMGM